MKKQSSLLISISFLAICFNILLHDLEHKVEATILNTNSRWIVDENGNRVKFACVNWPSHLQTMFPEGLSKQPLDVISKNIRTLGFNCVRLTYPTYLLTNESLASLSVKQSFENLGLGEFISGIQANNPSVLDLPLLQAYQAVVTNLGENNVMVILDNHISQPGWCCSETDGNGFFGDQYFDPDVWLNGLGRMAATFNGTSNVVAMSLRNELRGPNQDMFYWYKYMPKGAETVHSANPNVLVILSGMAFDTDLSFIKFIPVNRLTFTGKLVYEVHWYSFYNSWDEENANQLCGSVVSKMMAKAGFLLNQGWPLFLSEFGVNLQNPNMYESRFLNCILGTVAELDIDRAWWGLHGSYYLREGQKDMDEQYGVLNFDWSQIRNLNFLQKIDPIRSPFQGPGLSTTSYNIIYHPSSGFCILNESLKLGSCKDTKAWVYTPEKAITLKAANSCLQAVERGKSPVLGNACSDASSRWEITSDSMMHLSTTLADGTTLCLKIDNDNGIVTNECQCLDKDTLCDPANQWFKIISSARSLSS